MKQSFESSLVSVIGISMGDEGKGRVVPKVLEHEKHIHGRPAAGVMKVNGGANVGTLQPDSNSICSLRCG